MSVVHFFLGGCFAGSAWLGVSAKDAADRRFYLGFAAFTALITLLLS